MDIPVYHYDTLDSTNTQCRRLAAEGAMSAVVTADCQTAGRGRMGRSFQSPPGLGLYLSDPYTGSNFLSIILPVSAGVIVPVSTYTGWLAWLCSWVPGSRLVQALDTSGGIASGAAPDLFALLAADAALAVLYATVGLGLTLLAARRIRAGARASLL